MKNRLTLPRYARDPRLFLGIAMVVGGGVMGATLLSGHNDTEVLRARETVAVGHDVTRESLETIVVPDYVAESYIRPGDFTEARAAITIHAGDLVRRTDLTDETGGVVLALPLAVPVPSDVEPGSVVDVWRITAVSADKTEGATRIAVNAIVHSLASETTLVDGSTVVEVRVSDGVESILSVLGTDDEFAITGAGSQ